MQYIKNTQAIRTIMIQFHAQYFLSDFAVCSWQILKSHSIKMSAQIIWIHYLSGCSASDPVPEILALNTLPMNSLLLPTQTNIKMFYCASFAIICPSRENLVSYHGFWPLWIGKMKQMLPCACMAVWQPMSWGYLAHWDLSPVFHKNYEMQ